MILPQPGADPISLRPKALMSNAQIYISFDGGCKPNPGAMYGSYHITHDHGFRGGARPIDHKQEIPLGQGTNNRAEYKTMILAVQRTLELLDTAGLDPKIFSVFLITDSNIVATRMNGNPVVNGDRVLRELGLYAESLLSKFKKYEATWVERSNMVDLFGH